MTASQKPSEIPENSPEHSIESCEERFCHRAELALPSLNLDVYTSPELADDAFLSERLLPTLPGLWASFLAVAGAERIPQTLGLRLDGQTWEVDLNIVSDPVIREINRSYRGKDEATDVLSFALLADSGQGGVPVWSGLPSVQIGSLFVSLEWARRAVDCPEAGSFQPGQSVQLLSYVSERVTHGLLHLMGVHHDTMAAYERVVAIQKRVLDAASDSWPEG